METTCHPHLRPKTFNETRLQALDGLPVANSHVYKVAWLIMDDKEESWLDKRA
jgi:hypothetical protein